jgi:hypothetical protein
MAALQLVEAMRPAFGFDRNAHILEHHHISPDGAWIYLETPGNFRATYLLAGL